MDARELASLNREELAAYLWRRFRLEAPVDPPLDRRFGMEAPEEFVFHALQGNADPALRARWIGAIRDNLATLALSLVARDADAACAEQVSSLALLAIDIEAAELAYDLYLVAAGSLMEAGTQGKLPDEALFHVLHAVARLQPDARLVPFWENLSTHMAPGIRATAYYGLSRAGPARAMDRPAEIIADEALDLPPIAWHLARESPGIIALGEAAGALRPKLRDELRTALIEAGADDAMLRDFDAPAAELDRLRGEIAAAAERGDDHQAAALRVELARRAIDLGQFDEAEALLQASLTYFMGRDDQREISTILFFTARLRREQGRLDDAWGLYERALALVERAGDVRGQGVTLHAMGILASRRDHKARAKALFDRGLALAEGLGDAELIAALRESSGQLRSPPRRKTRT
ncbi:MAG: tetratricopeptide repeat protein [Pseudomonadota bacterium]